MGRLVSTETPRKRLKIEESSRRRLTPADVALALGAEVVGQVPEDGNPFTAFLVRQRLVERLRSTGGRPALSGADIRPKVPMKTEQWRALEEIAKDAETDVFHPTAAQVAAILIEVAIENYARHPFDLGLRKRALAKAS